MDADKQARLEDAGFKVGTVLELLGLTPEQHRAVEDAVRARAYTVSKTVRDGDVSTTFSISAPTLWEAQALVRTAEGMDDED